MNSTAGVPAADTKPAGERRYGSTVDPRRTSTGPDHDDGATEQADPADPGSALQVALATPRPDTPPRVGIAGVGGVAAYAHVPAYRALGFPVALLYDERPESIAACRSALGPDAERARAVLTPGDMLAHLPGLGFLDVALPSPAHARFIGTLLDELGTDCPPLLVQKPLADARSAEDLVARAESLGVRMAVNLTGRWVPPFAALRAMVLAGAVGGDTTVSIVNRGWNPKDGVGWRSLLPELITFEMAVHHLDLVVWTFGSPRTVYAAHQHVGGHGVVGENVAHLILTYADGMRVAITEDWTCRDRPASSYHPMAEQIVVSGSRATLFASPQELRVTAANGEPVRYTWAGRWFPDAFAGPPAEFAQALWQRRASPLDARNHLPVLRVIDACYRSAATNAVVEVAR